MLSARNWLLKLLIVGFVAGCSSTGGSGGDEPSSCGAGQVLCGSACASVGSDPLNCGACGVACGAGRTCSAGACVCPAGYAECGGQCLDVASNAQNCGACGTACAAGQLCVGGSCQCQTGLTRCGDQCVNVQGDGANCGSCGTSCPSGQVCASGACGSECPPGALECGSSCVTPASDPLHCGSCGNACPAPMSCASGTCVCPTGTLDCGGACVDTSSDLNNCGTCGHACSGGTACVAGACVCGAGSALCGDRCVDVQADGANCGTCGNTCPGACVAGQCVPAGTGGAGTGGAATGGVTTGGVSTGGVSTGGVSTGGVSTGGVSTGGVSTGGVSTGGVATGGVATGGVSTGGVSTGGVATGGVSTGGVSTGGVSTGGVSTGGTGGNCTNVRPTGTEWDAATCDQWATQTSECAAAWMIDNHYCDQSCGRCTGGTGGTSTGGSGGTTGGSGGVTGGSGGTTGGSGGTSGGPRPACTAPQRYRNLFTEILGKTQTETDAKLTAAVNQLFHGTSDQTIYYERGTDQAYIQDIANNDIRSEGQSYAMLVAVQMGMRTEFDKLWRYAATCMRQPNGLFAWQMNPGTCTAKSTYAAPDGEEYFAMALMLASRRWGDSGSFNYANEARAVATAMLAPRPGGEFHPDPAIVSFGPYQDFSDPSYVLPLFYSEWACFDTAHTTYWNKATADGRTFFQRTTHATTGLAPYQANWDGSNYNNSEWNADAWRVPMNIMMDFNLNHADPWQTTWAQRMAAFWLKEGLSSYGSGYTLSGTKTASGHGSGLTGVNAMLAFAIPTADGQQFLQAAWNAPIPTGTYRYYDGCLYLLSMLHLTGRFSLFY